VPGPEPSVAVLAQRPVVYLSYAAEDEPYAKALREAINKTGFSVFWGGNSGVMTGDGWNSASNRAISDCVFFVPIISEHTESKETAYFRYEWRIASYRALLLGPDKPFIVPVWVGGLTDPELVPLDFRRIQSVRMEGLTVPKELVEFFQRHAATQS
jgi:hypothetical protein